MSKQRRLFKIYNKIPKMECLPGCSDCCGPVPFNDYELSQLTIVERGRLNLARENQEIICPFSTPKGCGIYERRPFMCRIFATADDPRLTCPHGCKPATPISSTEGVALTGSYIELDR